MLGARLPAPGCADRLGHQRVAGFYLAKASVLIFTLLEQRALLGFDVALQPFCKHERL